MESAAKKLVGEHDFRNFCKMDAANVHNYRRHITSLEMSPIDVRLRLVDNFSDPYMCVCECMFVGTKYVGNHHLKNYVNWMQQMCPTASGL